MGPPTEVVDRMGVVITLISKCRVAVAVEKYSTFMSTLREYGLAISTLEDPAAWASLVPFLNRSYKVCGKDRAGRNIFWISGSKRGIQPEEEALQVRAGALYW